MSSKKRVYLLAGDDEFPLNVATRKLINELMPEHEQTFGLEIIDGRAGTVDEAIASLKRCEEALVTSGFLSVQGKVIWWRDVSFLADGQPAQSESVRAQVKAFTGILAGGDGGDNTLIVTTPKIDRRSTFFKLCADRFEVREFGIPEKAYLAEQQAQKAFREGLRAHGLQAKAEVEALFLGRVGMDSRQIDNEVEKLALFVKGRAMVGADDVEAITSTSATSVMWDLQDAVGERDLARALRIFLDLLARKESPIGVVVSIFGRIRDLLLYRDALDRGWVRLTDGYGGSKQAEWKGFSPEDEKILTAALKRPPRAIHPFAAGKLTRQAQRYTLPKLKSNQKLVLEAHEKLVSSSIPQPVIIEMLLIKMMSSSDS